MKIIWNKSLQGMLLALSLAACQPRTWQASPSLTTTDVPVDSTLTADPQTEAFIKPFRQQVTAKMSEVIGFAPTELSKGDYQSALGNFVVDLQKAQSEPLYGKPIDLSLTTNGGLRQPLPQGNITVGNVFELMPFENELVVLTLAGGTVQELFDYAVEKKWAPIGGATYTIKNGKPTDIKIGGKPFDPNKSYTLVTSDYLAGGGDDLSMLKKATKTEKVGLLLRDAITRQITQMATAGKPVTADMVTRVTILP
ncbi:5'-nucleotidase [Pontibacter chitinilyticus]|uniref:5'-nucleotidase n=1 Tax=Pontibacter chitinilyticus TaxID=2674989 RepID=UPI00321B8A36